MNNIYTCKLHREFICAYIDTSLELSPLDYLYCDNEDELFDAISDDLHDITFVGDVNWVDSNTDVYIPNEFITEWKRLKENEASSM